VIAACFIGGASRVGRRRQGHRRGDRRLRDGRDEQRMSILGVGIDYQQVIKAWCCSPRVFVDVYNKNK